MCWNATSSLSFFIVGTIVNLLVLHAAIKEKKRSLLAFCVLWFFILVMQLLEFFIWSGIGNKTLLGHTTFYTNVLQIVFIYLAGLSIYYKNTNVSLPRWKLIVSTITVVLYLAIIAFSTRKMKNQDYIIRTTTKHLLYPWWFHISYWSLFYLVAMSILFLTLFYPFYWILLTVSCILLFFVLSYIVYKPYFASMWCFLSVLMPIVAYIFSRFSK
jgi:hypothetical protein